MTELSNTLKEAYEKRFENEARFERAKRLTFMLREESFDELLIKCDTKLYESHEISLFSVIHYNEEEYPYFMFKSCLKQALFVKFTYTEVTPAEITYWLIKYSNMFTDVREKLELLLYVKTKDKGDADG